MKRENGVTIAILVIMVILMSILAMATINYGTNSLDAVKFQNFKYEMEQIQGKVDAIYEKIKLGDEKYIILGGELTSSEEAIHTIRMLKGVDYNNVPDALRDDFYHEDSTSYRFFTQKQVQTLFNITSEPGDMIINFLTREVISVKGFTYKDIVYYTLDDMKY